MIMTHCHFIVAMNFCHCVLVLYTCNYLLPKCVNFINLWWYAAVMHLIYIRIVILGTCAITVALQGTSIPIIDDAQCDSIWGTSFQSSAMICVWGGVGGGIGSCNVRSCNIQNWVFMYGLSLHIIFQYVPKHVMINFSINMICIVIENKIQFFTQIVSCLSFFVIQWLF